MKKTILLLTTLLLVACTAQEKKESTPQAKEEPTAVKVEKPKERSGEELFEKACHGCHNYRIAIRNHGVPQWKNENMVNFIKRIKKGKHNIYGGGRAIAKRLKDVTPKEMQKIAEFIHKLNSGEVKMKPLPEVKPREIPKKDYKVIVQGKPLPLNVKSQEYKDFMKQKNRFMVNPCGMSYNEQPIEFGMSLEEIRNILGKESYSKSRYYWENKGIGCLFKRDKLVKIVIYLKEMNEGKYIGYKVKGNSSVVVFNRVLTREKKMHNFLDETLFSFYDFTFKHLSSGYSIRIKCNNEIKYYHFQSSPKYEVFNYGEHLSSVGNFLPKQSKSVDEITIARKKAQ